MGSAYTGGDFLLEQAFAFEQGWEKVLADGQEKQISQAVLERHADPVFREQLKRRIAAGRYRIRPPHEAQVPKDDGTMRTVYVNEPEDRLLLSAINDALFRLCPDMIHPSCKSYRSGIGCGKVAKEVSAAVQALSEGAGPGGPFGYKVDLSKYFDSVPLAYIDRAFDDIEARLGPSSVVSMLREYYHDDTLLDRERRPMKRYTSLRQGCAVAAFLADCVLRDIDGAMCASGAPYWRYSDDILLLGPKSGEMFQELSESLSGMGLTLNPKKVQPLYPGEWFTFLGFSMKGGLVTLSRKRIKGFQSAIESRTIRHPKADAGSAAALRRCARWLYGGGPSGYGWAEGVLPVVNAVDDIRELDLFLLDCLRACDTGRYRVGGLGWDRYRAGGAVARGRGRNVSSSRERQPRVPGYVPLSHMRHVLLASREAYGAYARGMYLGGGRGGESGMGPA